jgi:hypothetical protein
MGRWKFSIKLLALSALGVLFIISWAVILAQYFSIPDIQTLILSSISVISVVALTIITAGYAKSTEQMATQMKLTNDFQLEYNHRPKVIIKFDFKYSGAIYICIKNEGNGAAKNIKFSFTPIPINSRGDSLSKWPALLNGIDYLGPRNDVVFFFDTSFAYFQNENLPRDFQVAVQYDWAFVGKPLISEEYPLQLSTYMGTDLSSYKDFSTLIDEIEKIRKLLEKPK